MVDDRAVTLAERLRELRLEGAVKQRDLASALGVSVPLISAYENGKEIPTPERLSGYAHFFSTPRSLELAPPGLVEELDDAEDERRQQLEEELLTLRALADGDAGGALAYTPNRTTGPGVGPWHFADGAPVTIICGSLPEGKRADEEYTDRHSPDYIELYSYADLDALVELYGHVRAANPDSPIAFRRTPPAADPMVVTRDHLTTHVVLLGGVDFNPYTHEVLDALGVPVVQLARDAEHELGAFEVSDGERQQFRPALRDDGSRQVLVEDVAHFCRGPNPFNELRTVTVCNGMFGRGVYGAVRALTDARFRDRNAAFVLRRFRDNPAFSILMRVRVVLGDVITPDWTRPGSVLHAWPAALA